MTLICAGNSALYDRSGRLSSSKPSKAHEKDYILDGESLLFAGYTQFKQTFWVVVPIGVLGYIVAIIISLKEKDRLQTARAVSAQPVVSAPELAASAEATAELTSALGLLDGIQTFFFPSDGKKKMASVMLQSLSDVILWNCGWMLIAVCLVVINSACSQVYISPT